MGISGLLPALKTIHVTKHLSELNGQTVAVDVYGWLHKGVYSCATEIATGKATHKYVDYAMHRVRLLRHFGIIPYIVFDGGPLPAKKSTELERKRKRDENLARGKVFAAQGRHSQARECFIKCIDVTPQMAFQLIKALRAEHVQYVVAPYEADAQMAYLERTGIVSAILTEDSDLLVFGCRNVLFKLDVVASTVVSISRSDFASVSESCGVSLVGWSDVQFRAMSILSGCDYLPSIPGVGLKTACSLLRKWKTVEQVVRALLMEGKKPVPPRYLQQFKLAEKCFLHQRVFCPSGERLVHLTDIGGDWNEEIEANIGSDMDSHLAKQIACGDVDPVSLLPMKDINPNFVPRSLTPSALTANASLQRDRRKAAKGGGILSFFGPNPDIQMQPKQPVVGIVSRRASGKRTLAEVLDQDLAVQKKKRSQSPSYTHSMFFPPPANGKYQKCHKRAPSTGHIHSHPEKENISITVNDALSSEPDGSNASLEVHGVGEVMLDETVDNVVEQEEGYLSPASSTGRDAPDLSSPLRPGNSPKHGQLKRSEDRDSDGDDFSVEALSSPVSAIKLQRSLSSLYRWNGDQQSANPATPTKSYTKPSNTSLMCPSDEDIHSPSVFRGPDLRNLLDDDNNSDLDERPECQIFTAVSPSSVEKGQIQPNHAPANSQVYIDVDAVSPFDSENEQQMANTAKVKAVAEGWMARWALGNRSVSSIKRAPGSTGSRQGGLRRSDTNVTPLGRHSLPKSPWSMPTKANSRLDIKHSR